MKKAFKLYFIGAFIIVGALIACRQKQKNIPAEATAIQNNAYYTCSMHLQVHEDHPGNCPICSMKLIKVETTGDSTNDRLS